MSNHEGVPSSSFPEVDGDLDKLLGAEAAEGSYERERLLRCLDQLTDLQREAIALAFYGGDTYRQVATILGAPLGTVKTRIRDAIIKLRDAMLSGE